MSKITNWSRLREGASGRRHTNLAWKHDEKGKELRAVFTDRDDTGSNKYSLRLYKPDGKHGKPLRRRHLRNVRTKKDRPIETSTKEEIREMAVKWMRQNPKLQSVV